MYVRLYDEQRRGRRTIHGRHHSVRPERCFRGALLVLHGNEQLFASKYKLVLPTEEELRVELEREQLLLESVNESERKD